MSLTDLVKTADRFKNADGTPADFKRGRTIRHFVGSTYQHMLNEGWYLYVSPSYDPATHTLGGYIINVDHATREVIAKTPEELANEEETRKKRIRFQCTNHIEVTLGWDTYRKENADAGIYPVKFKVALDTVRSVCIAESNRCEDDPSVIPVWPVAPDALSYEEAKL